MEPVEPHTTPGAAPKVRARAVTRTFGHGTRQVHALGPLDLDIRHGEFCCIVGPSGCGKSTFLRIVAGLVRPSGGEVEIRAGRRHPAAMIPQDYGIYDWKTVLANVRFGLDVQRVPRKAADVRARDWLERLGLADFAHAYPATLSGGMRQRVAIARALAVEPEVLLLDEPFAALDAQLRTILQDELLAVCQATRTTALFVTHSLEEAIVLGDRVVVMSARPGRVIAERRPPFERPRTGAMRRAPRFAALHAELWELLRDEVQRAGAGAATPANTVGKPS
ncbi:ABC transporter ATPase [Streptomyces malaysiensis]|uniref:ABC transporter ATPase n=1 Tax=Streptomyces malaysiensis TaxID=92644 RepID=A0A7X5XBA4_STRMQ|nr:ABC transporter ATPase [Streptomyces malaysiensis]